MAGALLAALGLAELVLRCLTPAQLGFVFNGKIFHRPLEFVADKGRNRLGFHDVEHAADKPPGTRRVLLLGDSFVEAGSVALEQTVGRRLEHWLNAPGGPVFEVIACGRSGFGQVHQLEVLQQLGPALRPDLVVTLFLHANDVADNSPALKPQTQQERHEMHRFQPGWARMTADEAPLLVFRWSVLNQLLSHRVGMRTTMRTDAIPTDYLVYAVPEDPRFTVAWRDTWAALQRTRDLCRDLGARYVLVSASTPHGVRGARAGLAWLIDAYPGMAGRGFDLDLPDARVAAFCATESIPCLLLEPELRREAAAGRTLHWPYDGHWNVEGNELAAQRIAAFLLRLLR